MKTPRTLKLTRKQLDEKFKKIREANFQMPSRGWINAIREALGMSQAQLAKRLKISRQGLNKAELQEVNGNLEVKTLKKIAEGINCDLIYFLVPKESLEKMIDRQVELLAKKIVMQTEKHMALENQGTKESFQKKMIAELSEELKSKGAKIWEVSDGEN